MTKFSKNRWQKLAGILKEGDVVSLDNFRNKKQQKNYNEKMLITQDGKIVSDLGDWLVVEFVNDDQKEAIINGDIKKAEELGARFFEVGPKDEMKIHDISESINEKTSPEGAQDIAAYFGSNDSIDGPYNVVAKNQPFDDDKDSKK